MLKNFVIVALIVMTALETLLLLSLRRPSVPVPSDRYLAYSDFVHEVDAGQVSQVSIRGSELKGVTMGNKHFQTYLPEDSTLVPHLVSKDVRVTALPPTEEAPILRYILSWVPLLVLTGLPGWYMSRMARAISDINLTMKILTAKSPILNEP